MSDRPTFCLCTGPDRHAVLNAFLPACMSNQLLVGNQGLVGSQVFRNAGWEPLKLTQPWFEVDVIYCSRLQNILIAQKYGGEKMLLTFLWILTASCLVFGSVGTYVFSLHNIINQPASRCAIACDRLILEYNERYTSVFHESCFQNVSQGLPHERHDL